MKTILFCTLGALLFVSFHLTQADNIIFLGYPYFSHIKTMVSVASELQKLGHDSHFLATKEMQKRFEPIKGIHYVEVVESEEKKKFDDLSFKMFSPEGGASWKSVQRAMQETCNEFLFDENLYKSLKSINASLAIIDEIFPSNCMAIIPYNLSIPFVLLGAQNQVNLHRTPWSLPSMPHKLFVYSDRMSFIQRFLNALLMMIEYTYPPLGTPDRPVKEYAPDKPDISFDDLMHKADLYLIDDDLLLDYPRPALPNVKYVGGLVTKPAEPLKGDLLKFVNTTKNGIIIVSTGSFVNDIPEQHIKKLEEAFKKIKYDVVWKRPKSSYSQSNVYTMNWLPQNDLLGHPKTKLFITHCGNNGQFEALYHAVPMLGFPIFADQPFNGHRMHVKGYGISMDMKTYNIDDLVRNIEEIIDNPKYKSRIQKASDIYRSRREHPAAKSARHVDNIIKHGGGHLRSFCQDMPFYQYFMLDIFFLLALICTVFIAIVVATIRKCLLCCRKKEKNE